MLGAAIGRSGQRFFAVAGRVVLISIGVFSAGGAPAGPDVRRRPAASRFEDAGGRTTSPGVRRQLRRRHRVKPGITGWQIDGAANSTCPRSRSSESSTTSSISENVDVAQPEDYPTDG